MKKKYLKVSNCLLTGMLALLGCSSNEPFNDPDIVLEYGTPSATYQIKGKVVDHTTKEPLRDMKVVVTPGNNSKEYFSKDTLTTSADGTFAKDFERIFPCDEFKVIAQDTTGNYGKDSIQVTITKQDYAPGSSSNWFSGIAKKEVTVMMKKILKK